MPSEIRLTEDNAKRVLAALDQARVDLLQGYKIVPAGMIDSELTRSIIIMRTAIGITEQDRAALVARTARGEHE